MKKLFFKNKKRKGFAILFTMIIVSAIAIVIAGLTNTAYKQLILSSLAKDSQAAFYESDTATDCALYADRVESAKLPLETNLISKGDHQWYCGGLDLIVTSTGNGNFNIEPVNQTSVNPCFRIDVKKEHKILPVPTSVTTMSARGYNICNISNKRTVEREIEIVYDEQL